MKNEVEVQHGSSEPPLYPAWSNLSRATLTVLLSSSIVACSQETDTTPYNLSKVFEKPHDPVFLRGEVHSDIYPEDSLKTDRKVQKVQDGVAPHQDERSDRH